MGLPAETGNATTEAEAKAPTVGHEGAGSIGAHETVAAGVSARRRAVAEEQRAPKSVPKRAVKEYVSVAR